MSFWHQVTWEIATAEQRARIVAAADVRPEVALLDWADIPLNVRAAMIERANTLDAPRHS